MTNCIVVKKFGGTSLANIDCIHHVANVLRTQHRQDVAQVIVVSASAGTTNQLVGWCERMSSENVLAQQARDFVVSSGEWASAGLLAMALNARGLPAKPWAGWQLPLVTDSQWGRAQALQTNTSRLLSDIQQGIIPVVCGFQGVTSDGWVTTLGRGGSDTTAVLLAAALKTDHCEIYTDVTGVYSADPSVVDNAIMYPHVSYDSMWELSCHGAKVLHAPCVQWASTHHIPLHVRSTVAPHVTGTWVKKDAPDVWGVTCRPVLVWQQDALVSHSDTAMSWLENSHPIDWTLTPQGVQWLTWVEDQKSIQHAMPQARIKQQAMLISVIGPIDPAIHAMVMRHPTVYHRFVKKNLMGAVLPSHEAYELVRQVHDHWLKSTPNSSQVAQHCMV
jgi:aspartokinase